MKKIILFGLLNFATVDINNDPTLPPSMKRILNIEYKFQLKAIIITKDKKECFINNEFFTEDDQVNDFIIKEITKDKVKIKNEVGYEITLDINNQF